MLNTKYLNELSDGLAVAIGSYFDSYEEWTGPKNV
jgi:hypothetical protein